MTDKEKTEQKILDAAKDVFQRKGLTGARMQEIADTAGINKALLHYYYRTKDKLFEKVFGIAFSIFIPRVKEMMASERPLFIKINFFVDTYLQLIEKHPFIPGFVISELNRNPKILVNVFEKNVHMREERMVEKLQEQIDQEVEQGIIKPITVQNLMANIVGLCLFPIVARPILQGVLFYNDKEKYDEFLLQRNEAVKSFVINSIKT